MFAISQQDVETTSDSDVSDYTQDLIRQGLASVRRKRIRVAVELERPTERLSVPNVDTSRIRLPLDQDGLVRIALTHGLNPAGREIVEMQNHNNMINRMLVIVEAD